MDVDITPLSNAIERLVEGVDRHRREPNDTQIRDGLIQRFEFTYEIAHKTLKRYLERSAASPTEFEQADFAYLIRSANERCVTLPTIHSPRMAPLESFHTHRRSHGF